ncbi:MAG: T9SS type A sorting domain-containing protein [Bacteroidales bacterium]|nr:T9SS type A sorting domain-containing protein [Bacteroidales bacterium]
MAVFCIAILTPNATKAQYSHGGEPMFNHAWPKSDIANVTLPTIDNQELLQQDIDMVKGSHPMRISKAQSVSIDNRTDGTVSVLADGTHVWRIAITSPGAKHMSLDFDRFELPEGATLYIYDATGEFVLGSYIAEDTLEGGRFYTQEIPGSECRIEYHEPANVAGQGHLHLCRIYHGYKELFNTDILGLGYNDSKDPHGESDGNCHINVVCEEGDNWRDQIRSVVCISLSDGTYSYVCSGALINNTKKDKTPYILSANHCQEDMTVTRWVFYFNYQTNTCAGRTGVYNQSVTGATIKAKYAMTYGSDFLLLQMNRSVPNSYKAYFAGWDRSNVSSVTPGCGIHHPGGAYKKISIPRSISQGTSGGYTRFWYVYWYSGTSNKGVTEGGSSGSPLFGNNGLIIGQLQGGTSKCNYSNNLPGGYDLYGRMFNSWTGGGSSSTRLRDWLDPDGTNPTRLEGINYDYSPVDIDVAEEERQMLIYPNPSKDRINLKIDEIGRANYRICDLSGRTVCEGTTILTTTAQQINVSTIPAGTYRLQLDCNGHTYSHTIIKL